jgi:hypothetical protein
MQNCKLMHRLNLALEHNKCIPQKITFDGCVFLSTDKYRLVMNKKTYNLEDKHDYKQTAGGFWVIPYLYQHW